MEQVGILTGPLALLLEKETFKGFYTIYTILVQESFLEEEQKEFQIHHSIVELTKHPLRYYFCFLIVIFVAFHYPASFDIIKRSFDFNFKKRIPNGSDLRFLNYFEDDSFIQ